MRSNSASAVVRYGFAVAVIAVAIAIRWALAPWLGATFPLATVFTAIAFVVWRAGAGPAVVTMAGGWLAGTLVFRPAALSQLSFNEGVQFLLYLVATVPIIALGASMRAAQQALEQRHDELSSTNLALENKVEAQSLLAAIVASSDDAIISKTLDGIITSWNRGAEQLFGWTAEQAIGQSIHLLVPEEWRGQERDFLDRLRRGERIARQDVPRVRKDGTVVPVSIRISPVYDRHGHIIGASTTASDITQRKAWETQLMRSEEAQRLLVGVHDATRGIEDASLAMREIVTRVGLHFNVVRCAYGEVEDGVLIVSPGYTRNLPTVAGRYALDVFGPDLVAVLRRGETAMIEDVRTSALTRTPTAQQTYAQMGIVSMVVVPLVRSGRLVAILVMCDDAPRQWAVDDGQLLEQVAERTLFAVESARAAAALRENRDALAVAAAERQRAVEALQEADRRKDEFLATLAHELRNPLAPINAGLHILRTAQDGTQSAAALQIMERQVNHMVRLIDDLLDVARITTGKVELRCEPIDLAAAIGDAIETAQPAAGPARFTVVAPPEPVYVNADRTRLAQVFSNLLNNGVKYSDPGRPITLTFGRDGTDAFVRIRDNGIGIQPEMLPRVFEMFRQVEHSGGMTRGGLGIGLSLVKRIVELHGGTVEAYSEGLNRGSEFTVRIPAIEAPSHAQNPRTQHGGAPAHANGRGGKRILVVDDNADAAEALATLLSIHGHETRMAHDGNDALKTLEHFHPDVVFLDIGMPVLDGHATARLIRQQPWGKDVVLVALTGWGQTADRRRSKEAGFNHHLVKPADPQQVEQLLSSL